MMIRARTVPEMAAVIQDRRCPSFCDSQGMSNLSVIGAQTNLKE